MKSNSKVFNQNKFFIAVLVMLLSLFPPDSMYGQKTRSMWVWNSANIVSNIIDNIGNYRSELFEFCRSPHGNPDNKITVLFLSCRVHVYANSNNLRNFLSEACDSGLAIEYLDGDPSWATYKQADGFDRINKVLMFNASSTSEKEKIKGIHFDVEPYLLRQDRGYQPPYWDTDKMTVWESYVTYMDSCQRLIDSADSNLYFGIAIPRWYENHVGVSELKRLQEKVDYVAIMDYNENASVIINDAQNEMNHANELSKKVWIGVETGEVSPETVSFFEEGVAYMESQLNIVNGVYGNNPDFLGFAIHSYKSYKILQNDPLSVGSDLKGNKINFVLEQNYPNPFNPSTIIRFNLPEEGNVSLKIYDILGIEKEVLINGRMKDGWHEVEFSNEDLSAGVYIYELSTVNFREQKKMILLK